jgi:hypothetical protein
VADAVLVADPVKQHHRRLAAELAGEDLTVIRQDLIGDAVLTQSVHQRIADRTSRRSHHQPRADAEARMVVDAGDNREFGPIA